MLSAKMKIGVFGHTTVRNVMKTIIFLLDVIAGYALVGKEIRRRLGGVFEENTFDVPINILFLVCRLYYGMSYATIGKLGR